MDKNLLGEKKENEKEGCGRRKKNQQTVREERELQNNIEVSLTRRKEKWQWGCIRNTRAAEM